MAQRRIPVLVVSGLAASLATAAWGHDEVMVGHTAANQLVMHTHSVMPFELPDSVFPGITGFAGAEVALASLDADHPALGIFMLPETVDIRCVLLDFSPNMRVYNGLSPMAVGDEMVLGAPVIHYMPIWNITQGNPGEVSSAVFQFRDATNQMSASQPFTVTFTPAPAPGGVCLLGLGAVFATRRRR